VRNLQRFGFLRNGDHGQTLMLAPLFLFLFMVGASLIVDLGRVYVARRSAQAAVDFAALAAAQELPRSDLEDNISQMVNDAVFQANTYLRLNQHDPSADDVNATITPYYEGDVRKIRVEVQKDHSWIFAGYFGIPEPTVGAYAVAEANSTPRDVVVVLDRSGSMCLESHGGPMLKCPDLTDNGDGDDDDPGERWEPFDTMRDAAKDFTTAFTPSVDGLPFDFLGVVSYSDQGTLETTLTTDYGAPGTAYENAIDAMRPEGRTNIGHALYVARKEMENNGHSGAIQAIVLLTDGDGNIYNAGSDNSPNFTRCSTGCGASKDYALTQARLAAAQGMAIYTIGLTDNAGKELLVEIAQIGQSQGGGGAFFDVSDPDQLTETFL
jgi:hypothetical protein